jgi:predicted homoserine dehydrogenase-like protein
VIIVDTALRERERAGRPVRVGVFGAGSMARGFVNQVTNAVPGMVVAAISNRTVGRAVDAFRFAGASTPAVVVDNLAALDAAVAAGRPAVTDNPVLLAQCEQIDCLIDITGAMEFGAAIALEAIANGKHMVLMNAEIDATIGPILHDRARAAGVIFTCVDGDQAGVQMNLYRSVQSLGMVPRVLGTVKGLHDEYRTPTTEAVSAERWNQNVTMATSFADGSRVNFEQSIVANATGFTVAQRGMLRYDHSGHVDGLATRYDLDMLRGVGGIVEFVVGAKPAGGVFCLAEQPDARQLQYLERYTLGTGPLYAFYHPYHLCHLEAPLTVARVVLFGDACGQPLAGPAVEVIAVAKRDLRAGETLDSYGQYMTYGQAEKAAVVQRERLIPEGLVAGCRLLRDLPRDTALRWDDVEAPSDQLAHRLYAEQQRRFPV